MNGRFLGIALLALVAVGGCDNQINPIAEGDQFFVIQGFLDADADTQFVRVEPTRTALEQRADQPLTAEVTTTDLMTGETVIWQDSLITLDRGSVGHLFVGLFQPQLGHTYRFSVVREDGITTDAETTIPTHPLLRSFLPDTTFFGQWVQNVALQGLNRPPFRINLLYKWGPLTTADSLEALPEQLVEYRGAGQFNGEEWILEVRLSQDLFQTQGNNGLAFFRARMEVQLLSEDWPLEVGPVPYSNVRNGLGFLGATGRFFVSWRLDEDVLTELGYIDRQEN